MDNRKRYLSVPLNEKGIDELNYGVMYSDNIKVFELSSLEFEDMYITGGVFDQINEQCNLLIDDYESETIPNKEIDKCLDIVGTKYTKLREALNLAKEYNTFVDLDF